MNFKELMERAKNGNQAAVTELLMMYRPMFLKMSGQSPILCKRHFGCK